jgi:hypothetical protein
MFIPFANIPVDSPYLKKIHFCITVSGPDGKPQAAMLLHPAYNIFDLRTAVIEVNEIPQLVITGKIAVPNSAKSVSWPTNLFKNLKRLRTADIRGHQVYTFVRLVGSAAKGDRIQARIITSGGLGLARGEVPAGAETMLMLEEDPTWEPVYIPNQKGPQSPWYVHCRQRRSDHVVFCLYCSHSYGLRAIWGKDGEPTGDAEPEEVDMMEGLEDDGKGGKGKQQRKPKNHLVKGGMTSNIKRHVTAIHPEELQVRAGLESFTRPC